MNCDEKSHRLIAFHRHQHQWQWIYRVVKFWRKLCNTTWQTEWWSSEESCATRHGKQSGEVLKKVVQHDMANRVVKFWRKTYFNNQLNAQFLYSITICMLHCNPRHVSSINMPIFRRTNCIITASGIVTLCKRMYSMLDERLSSSILYSPLQRVTVPDAVIIQFVLLKMGMLMLETCRGL